MSAETNVQTSRRMLEECMNQGDLDLLDELCAPDCITHDPAEEGDIVGIDAHKERFGRYLNAMPDLQFKIEDQIASRDRVATRWSVRGTNSGELLGLPPTGRQITITGMTIERFDAVGKIAEIWDEWDNFSFMQQLGMIPEATTQQQGAGEILR